MTLFVFFTSLSAKYIFSNAYKELINDKISIVENDIKPSISLNLSYQFYAAIHEICEDQITNKDILLLQIDSEHLETSKNKSLLFTKGTKRLKDYQNSEEFISVSELIDPLTKNKIGEMTIVYSKSLYEKYMNDFYEWLIFGIIAFSASILGVSYFLYTSLKPLNFLVNRLKSFNPYKPEKISCTIESKQNEFYNGLKNQDKFSA